MRVVLSMVIGAIPAMLFALWKLGGEEVAHMMTPVLAVLASATVVFGLFKAWYGPIARQA